MFGLSDIFQWERFVTPTVIKFFYWLAVVISVLLGFAGVVSSLTTMAYNPFVGLIFLIASVLGTGMGIVISRIGAQFVLIVFRINEHLGAIRNRGQMWRAERPNPAGSAAPVYSPSIPPKGDMPAFDAPRRIVPIHTH